MVLNANRLDSFIDLDLQFLPFQSPGLSIEFRIIHKSTEIHERENIFLVNNNCKEQLCRQIESKQCRWTKDVSIEGTVIKNFNEKPEKKVKKGSKLKTCNIDYRLWL